MLILNDIINQSLLEDKIINDEVKVENKIVYIEFDEIKYKYDRGNYWQNVGENNWVNLQGGIPGYQLDSEVNPDEYIFHELIES